MKKKLVAIAASAVLAFGCFALAACGSSQPKAPEGEDAIITIGATPTPHAEVLTNAVAPILAEQGYELQVTEFTDYVQPNTAVENGELDANYFQHINYMDSFNAENGTHLVNAGYVHYEPMGLYGGKSADLANIADGASVAVPNDTTNEARALLLLQQEGLITLAEDAGITATPKDTTENPHNLKIVELEAASVPHQLADVDFACINGNYALQASLSIADALAYESDSGIVAEQYGNIISVLEGNENSDKIKALVAACQSDAVKQYIEETYSGAVVPMSK